MRGLGVTANESGWVASEFLLKRGLVRTKGSQCSVPVILFLHNMIHCVCTEQL